MLTHPLSSFSTWCVHHHLLTFAPVGGRIRHILPFLTLPSFYLLSSSPVLFLHRFPSLLLSPLFCLHTEWFAQPPLQLAGADAQGHADLRKHLATANRIRRRRHASRTLSLSRTMQHKHLCYVGRYFTCTAHGQSQVNP